MKTMNERRNTAYKYTEKFIESMIEVFHDEEYTLYMEEEPEEIEYNPVSGFIPFTDGGHTCSICGLISMCESTGSMPKSAEKYVNQQREEIDKAFCEEYGLEYPLDWDTMTKDLAQEYYDFENDYNSEEPPFFLKAQAIFYGEENSYNIIGEDEICFRVYLNYDFEYGRDYVAWAGGDMTKGVWETVVRVADLENGILKIDVLDEIIKEGRESLEKWY